MQVNEKAPVTNTGAGNEARGTAEVGTSCPNTPAFASDTAAQPEAYTARLEEQAAAFEQSTVQREEPPATAPQPRTAPEKRTATEWPPLVSLDNGELPNMGKFYAQSKKDGRPLMPPVIGNYCEGLPLNWKCHLSFAGQ